MKIETAPPFRTTEDKPNFQINEHVYAIDPHMYFALDRTKIYLISSEKKALIDLSTSYTVEHILQGFEDINHSIEDLDYLLITHHHYDHCGCLSALAPKMPKAEICASLYARYIIKNPDVRFPLTLFLYGKDFWTLAGDYKPLVGRDIRIISEGDVIDLGDDVRIRVIEMPGHEYGTLGYYEEKTKTLFVGDALGVFCGFYQPAAFKHGFTYFDFIRTLERTLSIDFEHICWSHSGCFNREEGKQLVRHAIGIAKLWREVVEKSAAENPTLEYIYDKVNEAGLINREFLEVYPDKLVRTGTYAMIGAFANSLEIEVPAELTAESWQSP